MDPVTAAFMALISLAVVAVVAVALYEERCERRYRQQRIVCHQGRVRVGIDRRPR